MAQKINLNTLTSTTLNILSEYHIAYKAICEYDRQKKEQLKKIHAEQDEYVKTHDPEKDKTYSLEKFIQAEAKVQAWYKSVTDPLKEQQKPALALVDKDIYYAYSIAMLKGSLTSKGKLAIGKTGEKTFEVGVSYQKQIEGFLVDMGCSNLTENTLRKTAQAIAIRCGGMMKDNKGEYLKLRNVSNFRNILILAFLQYAIIDRRALVVNADNTLSRNLGEGRHEMV